MIYKMGMELRLGQMDRSIKDITVKERNKARVHIHGMMVQST